ncbi:Asp-tRNA(Asn)/Glu-tRNA(Gln) amidotransferase subunit GatC [Candidatus Parcubacteria bacterium]|nr:Asp-tRNA(Asn)/Glu-tRNA(Gln) amidotransferase subunit GatC [Candidatus Parcubacteria bacterium]MBI4385365.1 Asp-tRNA(Asn)/Glu-tRNA(Gln) amidotransferase subunit GatC [Candidatus Parcubacteria bacterium]
MTTFFDADDIEHIARLARVKIEGVELGTMGGELSHILSYVAKLQECDTAGVEPTAQVGALENAWRDDGAGKIPPHDPKVLTESFPKSRDGFLEVEAVFEEWATRYDHG